MPRREFVIEKGSCYSVENKKIKSNYINQVNASYNEWTNNKEETTITNTDLMTNFDISDTYKDYVKKTTSSGFDEYKAVNLPMTLEGNTYQVSQPAIKLEMSFLQLRIRTSSDGTKTADYTINYGAYKHGVSINDEGIVKGTNININNLNERPNIEVLNKEFIDVQDERIYESGIRTSGYPFPDESKISIRVYNTERKKQKIEITRPIKIYIKIPLENDAYVEDYQIFYCDVSFYCNTKDRKEITKTYGSSNQIYEYKATNFTNEAELDLQVEKLRNDYKIGKDLLTIEIPIIKLYNINKELVINSEKGDIPRINDIFYFYDRSGKFNYKKYVIVSTSFTYSGCPKIKIIGKECVDNV